MPLILTGNFWVITIKKVLFYVVLIGVNYVFLELISYGFYRVKYGDYVRHDLQLERIRTINKINAGSVFTGENDDSKEEVGVKVVEILHPYAGFTVDGTYRLKDCEPSEKKSPYECYSRIRHPNDSELPKRQPGVLNVALLGGSVAVATVNGIPGNYYQRKLSALPEYKGYKVNVHMMAAGGYRQPQPLMMLNYYYTLGAEYDLVISLDGFNEVAIGTSEYKRYTLHPSFPRSWNHRVSNRVKPELIDIQAKRIVMRENHIARASRMSNLILRNSPTSNLLWEIMHQRYLVKESELNQQITNIKSDENKPRDFLYEKLGPDYEFQNWDEVIKDTVRIWARSNHLAYGVAQVHGANFFHFLQPNQYIEGSKPSMSKKERALAIAPSNRGGGYGAWYKRSYPFVKQQQQWMLEKGINSNDLTYLYKDESTQIYIDNCCHVNRRGSKMIVDAIVETIHKYNLLQQTTNQTAENTK